MSVDRYKYGQAYCNLGDSLIIWMGKGSRGRIVTLLSAKIGINRVLYLLVCGIFGGIKFNPV